MRYTPNTVDTPLISLDSRPTVSITGPTGISSFLSRTGHHPIGETARYEYVWNVYTRCDAKNLKGLITLGDARKRNKFAESGLMKLRESGSQTLSLNVSSSPLRSPSPITLKAHSKLLHRPIPSTSPPSSQESRSHGRSPVRMESLSPAAILRVPQ